MHRVNDAGNQLDPTDHLGRLHRPPMLAELNRPLSALDDQGQEIVRKAPIETAAVARDQPHQLALRPAILNLSDGVPRILTPKQRRRRLGGRIVADAVGGMQAVELVLEHGRQHAEVLERLQREAAPAVPDVDVEATGRVDLDSELSLEHRHEALEPPERLGAKAQSGRFDLDVALEVSVDATTVLDTHGRVRLNGPFLIAPLNAGMIIAVGLEAVVAEDLDDLVAADDSEFVVVRQPERLLLVPEEAFGERDGGFEFVGTEDDDALDFDAEGEVQRVGHVVGRFFGRRSV